MAHVARLTIRGFKSIQALEDFELRGLNVLAGANGAGKSNFIGAFRLLAALMERRFQAFVQDSDGPDALMFGGRKRTPEIELSYVFHGANYSYDLLLRPSGDRLIIASEQLKREQPLHMINVMQVSTERDEASFPITGPTALAGYVPPTVARWRIYHFNDTGATAAIRHAQPARDNVKLKPDGGNLAPFLRMLREQHPERYGRIIETVRMVAPFFGDFVYRTPPEKRVELEWVHIDDPDTPLGVRQLSDGTLRFVALTTLLLQPHELQPDTILIDEPELGLHPFALGVLAALLRQASDARQIIVSTQSVELINHFKPEDVIIVDRRGGASVFERLESDALAEWLADYTLGDLWSRNVVGGGPSR